MSVYRIVDFSLRLHGEWLNSMDGLPLFLAPDARDGDSCDMEISSVPVASLPLPSHPLFDGMLCHTIEEGHQDFCLCVPHVRCSARLRMDPSLRHGVLSYVEEEFPDAPGAVEILIETVLHLVFIQRKVLFLHSSAVLVDGGAIVFTAPSGTGKTTQANLWVKERNALVINGDRPAIRPNQKDEGYDVCGTPWSGSSCNYANRAEPIRCVVLLEQASENRLMALTPQEAVKAVLPRVFLPYVDTALMPAALAWISSFCQKVRFYRFGCLPDATAVAALWKGISELWSVASMAEENPEDT
mgnify:CR=1 FL=1